MKLPTRRKRKISRIRSLLARQIYFIDCKRILDIYGVKNTRISTINCQSFEYKVPVNDSEVVYIPFEVVFKPAPNI